MPNYQAGAEMAERIQARAIRRCGELLKQIEPAKNQHDAESRAYVGTDISRSQAATDAGLSERQKVTALRVANVHRRHLNKGQQAMVTAMAYPEAKRGRGNIDPSKSVFNTDFSSAYLKHARHVLRNNLTPEGQQYPDRCLAVMAGTLALTEASPTGPARRCDDSTEPDFTPPTDVAMRFKWWG